jgi:hypothetical protein
MSASLAELAKANVRQVLSLKVILSTLSILILVSTAELAQMSARQMQYHRNNQPYPKDHGLWGHSNFSKKVRKPAFFYLLSFYLAVN